MRGPVIEMGLRACALAAAVALLAGPAAGQPARDELPAGFARLRQIAPDVFQDMRYAGTFNITGKHVPGYEAAHCILWRPAAEALARAQARLAAEGFRLKVYDCYRPARAVAAFAAWSKAPGGDEMKPVFYPALDKSRLFALGYISSRSRHSRGIAVDVGLVGGADAELPTPSRAGACDGPLDARANESSLDLGTAFDCFSDRSATADPAIPAEARANRGRLRHALEREGFRNYAREWWHFEFADPRAPVEAQDFPVR
jgi:D-alanyl-D-alanine dipeptidase